jgi:choline dehydrogenase-like flavoprotein
MSNENLRCQVLVIGSGPGGSVTASTLADHGKDVLLLEEGRHLRNDSCAPFSSDEIVQKYRSGGLNPALGKPNIPFVEGCCVGGGSEINSGLYHRTPPEVLELWRKDYRVQALGEKEIDPHFEFCEKALSVRLNPGRIPVSGEMLKWGADRLGWKSKEVPRWYKYPELSSPKEKAVGVRQSMSESFVPSFLKSGGRLMAGVRAEKLRSANGHWTLSALQNKKPIHIEAESVFICAGAVQTPALLRRSGIKKNAGNSLAMHPTVKVTAAFDEEINTLEAEVPAYQITEFSPRICLGCSISSEAYLTLALTDYPEQYKRLRAIQKQMAIYYGMIQGPATGTVRNVPFSDAPLIRYHLTPQNLRGLSEALLHLCRALFAAGAKTLYPSISGFKPLQTEGDLERIPAELPSDTTNLMTIHLFSSCPMGEDLARCAVNSFGKVHGHANLYVNDASILCTALGVNPQGTIMGIARRNAMHFVEHDLDRGR